MSDAPKAAAPTLSAGDAVELIEPLVTRPHIRAGTRGRVLQVVEHGRLVEVQFVGERQPPGQRRCVMERPPAHLRRPCQPSQEGATTGTAAFNYAAA